MTPMREHRFRYPPAFPNEAFVQQAIERHFKEYVRKEREYVDFVCEHPLTSDGWVIEIKGQTKATGLDFRTCLGQIVLAMRNDHMRYAIALPGTPALHTLCSQVAPHVRIALNLYWLIVDQARQVVVVAPDAPLPMFSAAGSAA